MEELVKQLRIAEMNQDKARQFNAYYKLANLFCMTNKKKEAIACFEKLRELMADAGNKKQKANVECNLGALYQHTGQYQKAIECFQEALPIALEIGDNGRAVQASFNLGVVHTSLEEFYKAAEYLTQSLEMAREMKNRYWEGKSLVELGIACVKICENDTAEQHLKDCLVIALELKDYDLEADVYEQLRKCWITSNHHDKAIVYFKKLLDEAKQTNNVTRERIAYYNLAHVHDGLKQTSQVIEYYLKYLKVSPQDSREKYDVYSFLATAYQSTYCWTETLKYFQLALETARRIKYKDGEGKAYEKLGICHLEQGNMNNALECYEKHLELAKCLSDKNKQGRALANIAAAYDGIGKNDKVIEYSERALKVALELNDETLQVSIYGSLGNAYKSKQEYDKAIDYHKRKLEISTKIGSKQAQITACSSIGSCYEKLAKYFESIKWHKEALAICTAISDESKAVMVQTNLGLLHQTLGDYHKAHEYLTKSLEIVRKKKDRYHEGTILNNLCENSVRLDDWKKVNEYSKEVMGIAIETKNRSIEVNALNYLAICKIHQGQYDEALHFIKKQISLSEEIGNKNSLYSGYFLKGKVYHLLQQYQKAENCFEEALKISKHAGNMRGEAEALTYLGGAIFAEKCSFHHDRGEEQEYQNALVQSIHFLNESLHCWELQFEQIQDQDHFKISILERFILNYNTLAVALLMKNDSEEALMAAERGRARALNDLLTLKYGISNTRSSQHEPISYEEILQVASNFSVIFYYINPKVVFTWLINRKGCESQFCNKTSFSDIVSDAYSVLKVREATCEVRFIETEEQRQSRSAVQLEVNKIDVPVDILASNFKRCVYDEDISQPLEQLYMQLIAPVIDKLTEHDEIVIIPDGSLYTVPFAALKDPATGSYLSETKCIRLAPSLTSLKTLQNTPADFHSKSCALVIGNPRVGEVMFRGKKIDISNLPGAEHEAKKISEFLGVEPILGSLATKGTIKHHLRKGVAVVHFAAHGTRDGEIFLAPPPRGNQPRGFKGEEQLPTPFATTQLIGNLPDETDYLLTMKDVQESDVRPQLVVLSCCHSGRGEVKADGVIGMTRAFLAAGARAVVASLWAIADDATMVFMERFYKHLKQRKSASKSLHLAMKDMREMPRYSEPRFWAPFFLIGDDVTVEI